MLNELTTLLDGRSLREVEPGLYSVLAADAPEHRYDRRAQAYDRLIGSRLYNRLFWGTSPASYRAFTRRALASSTSGWLLDAGCGTLLLTGDAYCAAPNRPVVAVDHSLGMLRQARSRLQSVAGSMPSHILLLQADLLDLPFAPDRFATILSMGMFHLFDDLTPILESFRRVLGDDGELFFSSLLATGRIGDRYLHFLHRAGEVATPRTPADLQRAVRPFFAGRESTQLEGNMAFVQARPME